ncbi:GNAT family N-acetyltransferase [Lapillicoccus sp.]|uniref:GNAT family N-acetyltransferase n=1 Tax=Lapillicoccus sp. TaxID=1909287 RepID=UPI0025CEE73A|nr:GNAT family N-acetyltransferase [Lapillicoccus sp.]
MVSVPDVTSAADGAARIRPAVPEDAEAWVETHLEAMDHAYAALMPPEFIRLQRQRRRQRVEDVLAELTSAPDDPGLPVAAWVAEDDLGMVAVARTRRGPADWEVERDVPRAEPELQLQTLYALPRAHGTGLGQALLETAIGERAAYLWLVGGNARAGVFYRRNGFVPDGIEVAGGPSWYGRPMIRHHRL